MRNLHFVRWLTVVCLLVWSGLAAPVPPVFFGTVVRVTDGDTIVVEDDARRRHKVRIMSIDAPEKGRRDRPGQAYSERSRQHLARLVEWKTVRLISPGRDDYGRVLARVWIGDVDIGLAQVCAGYAWVFEAFVEEFSPDEQGQYRACQNRARADRRGLWRGARPMPPWQWRYSHRDVD